jgi:hypothetical protein
VHITRTAVNLSLCASRQAQNLEVPAGKIDARAGDVLTRQTGASAVNGLAAGFWRSLDVMEKRLQPAREPRAGAHVGAAEPDTSSLRALRTAFGFRIIELSVFLTV